jgi:mannose-6-phosphate isomerase-like protein (cupin superfamily)
MDDLMQRTRIERAYLERHEAVGSRAPEIVDDGTLESCSACEQHADVLVPQAPHRVRERPGGRRVEPLHIVDGDEHRSCTREASQDVEKCDAGGMGIRRGPLDVLQDESPRERRPLAGCEGVQCVLEHGVEEIAEPRKAQPDLGLRGLRPQHAEPARLGFLHGDPPQGRLAHPGFAFEHERRSASRNPGEEGLDGGELVVPPYEGNGHGRPIVRLRDTVVMAFAIFRQDAVDWIPRDDGSGRAVAGLSDSMTQSRANIWRYPPGARGKRHADKAQEEVFVVLDGTLTVDLGEPPERHELERGSVLVVQPGTILQLRNTGDEELVLFIYGAPPVREGADFFEDVP